MTAPSALIGQQSKSQRKYHSQRNNAQNKNRRIQKGFIKDVPVKHKHVPEIPTAYKLRCIHKIPGTKTQYYRKDKRHQYKQGQPDNLGAIKR